MTINIVAVGKFRSRFLGNVFREYQDRANRYFPVRHVQLKKPVYRKKDDIERILRKEGERLEEKMEEWGYTVVLDETGRSFTTNALAGMIGELRQRGIPKITFLVGGAFGIDGRVKSKADLVMSLSSLTVPHELARVLLMEQVYRCGTILAGEPYHKE
jgi:23S rRNA (pseudouridine1915-N3)-methyltransferase